MSGLPEGWVSTTLGELADFVMGQAPPGPACNFDRDGTPFVKAGEFGAERPIIREWTTKPLKMALSTDVLMCVVGATCGKLNLGADCAIGRSVAAIRPSQGLEQHFLYALLKPLVLGLRHGSTGSAQGVISKDQLAEIDVPLPPLAEQRRIVAKLNALTARTARARADLDRIPALAARYKQAVLAKAFNGSLLATTTAWPSKAIGNVIDSVVGGKNLRCEERPPRADELGVVKVSAVSWGAFNPRASKTLPSAFSPPLHTRIQSGDFLISRANTLELVGAVVVVDETPQNLFLSDKVLRLEMPESSKRWLMWFLRSPVGRAAIEAGSSGNQLSMRNLSQNALKQIQVPWPEGGVQRQIVGRIERAFAEIDRVTAEAAAARRLLDRLNQALLAKAFRGELVPQDPADEPASVLLDRIHAERATSPKPSRARRAAA